MVPLFANTDTKHSGTQGPATHTQCLPHGPAKRVQPSPTAPWGTAPGGCSSSAPTPGTASSRLGLGLLLGAGGSAPSPQSPQAPAPHTAPGAGGRQCPHPTATCRRTWYRARGAAGAEPLSLLHPWVRGLSPGVLFIATASAGRGRTPRDPGPAELPAGGRAGRCPPPGTTPAMGTRGDRADAKLGAGSPPVPATGGCWAGEEASPLLPRDPAAGGWVGGGGAARP